MAVWGQVLSSQGGREAQRCPRWHTAALAFNCTELRAGDRTRGAPPHLLCGQVLGLDFICPSLPSSRQSLYQLIWPRAEPASESQQVVGPSPLSDYHGILYSQSLIAPLCVFHMGSRLGCGTQAGGTVDISCLRTSHS